MFSFLISNCFSSDLVIGLGFCFGLFLCLSLFIVFGLRLKRILYTIKKDNQKIIRTYSAGVFFGTLVNRSTDGMRGTIKNARRLWYWDGAASLSQLAVDGVSKPENCKFPCAVSSIEVTQIIEVLETTKKARESIDGVKIWEK
jgi:hypothetical protein